MGIYMNSLTTLPKGQQELRNVAMKTLNNSDKISLTECKRILNINGNNYSDEEILRIRNWLYHYSEMTLLFLEKKTDEEIVELKKLIRKV